MTLAPLPTNYDSITPGPLDANAPDTLCVLGSPPAKEPSDKKLMATGVANRGVNRSFDIKPFWDSFYITGVEPGLEYYCDISIKK